MGGFFFWKDWAREHKYLYSTLGIIFLLTVSYFLVALILGADAILSWESLMRSEAVETVIDRVTQPPFTLPVIVDSYIFLEYFQGSGVTINEASYYIFLAITTAGLVYLLSVITYLPRFWYMVAMGLFVVLIISFKLELLLLFESTSKIGLIVALVLYLPLSYYFQSFNSDSPLYVRVLSFAVVTLVFGLLIWFSAGVELPFMQIAIYGMPSMLIASLVFTLLVSHDIIAGFLNAVSSGASSVGNWKHFFFITGIYLLNLLMIYLYETGAITWNILPVNVFIILLISALVGIWGYRQREAQYEYLFPFNPLGAVFYLSLATLTFSTVAFFYSSGNDPVLDVIHDVIIYSHLGYGFVFIMYVASNFLGLLTRGMPVNKILYKPGVMPYFTYRFAGILAFGALLFLESWELPVEKSFAGYYNGLGDLHTQKEELVLANGYYLQGSQYGYSNHRSNYSLAINARENDNIEKAIEHYERSNFSWPTEYSFINLSNIHFARDKYFEALFTLKEGLVEFPESGPILNNLGLMYAKIDAFDSAIYYLEKSSEKGTSSVKARNNLLAVLAKRRAEIDLDQEQWLLDIDDPVNLANAYAMYNSASRPFKSEYPGDENGINQFIHTGIYNYLINNLWRSDTLSYAVADSIYGSNMFLDRRLVLGKALNQYYKGNVRTAFELMNEIRIGDLFWTGDMNFLIGLWNLDNGEIEFARENMELARDNYNKYGQFGLAVANTLSGHLEEAIISWDSVRNQNITEYSVMAEGILPILRTNNIDVVKEWDDSEKYQWIRFHQAWEQGLDTTFEDDNYRAATYLDHCWDLIERDELGRASEVLAKADGLKVTNEEIAERLTEAFMEISAREGDLTSIALVLEDGYIPRDSVDRDHFRALFLEATGDTTTADQIYSRWAYKNPFEESLAVSASRFYEKKGDMERAYNWLQRAASLNSNSIFLQRNYVRMCGQLGYEGFGRYVLDLIQPMMDDDEFRKLLDEFEKNLEVRNESNFIPLGQ